MYGVPVRTRQSYSIQPDRTFSTEPQGIPLLAVAGSSDGPLDRARERFILYLKSRSAEMMKREFTLCPMGALAVLQAKTYNAKTRKSARAAVTSEPLTRIFNGMPRLHHKQSRPLDSTGPAHFSFQRALKRQRTIISMCSSARALSLDVSVSGYLCHPQRLGKPVVDTFDCCIKAVGHNNS